MSLLILILLIAVFYAPQKTYHLLGHAWSYVAPTIHSAIGARVNHQAPKERTGKRTVI